jgi:hypothetical protein
MTLVSLVIITLTSGYSVFLKGHWNTQSFLVSYIGIPIFLGKSFTVPKAYHMVCAMHTNKTCHLQRYGEYPGISFEPQLSLYDNSISLNSLRLKWKRNLRLKRRSFRGTEFWYDVLLPVKWRWRLLRTYVV